ncbi:ATP-binding protein [Streptomyces rochei]|uniref:ATP-binding protein n=1 Tax=Streptomyces rochei TaxID=1928 RepID=UPI0036351DE4
MGDAAAAGDRSAPSRFVRRPGPPGRRAAVMRRRRQAGNVGGGEVGAGVGQVLCFRRLSEPYRPGDQGVGHVQGPCRHQGPGRPAPPRRRRPLVTNALRHAPGPGGLLLEMHSSPARLRITVRDTSRAAPRLRVPDPYRIGGHGLRLISRLCSRFHISPRDGGKQVTAEMLLPQPAL